MFYDRSSLCGYDLIQLKIYLGGTPSTSSGGVVSGTSASSSASRFVICSIFALEALAKQRYHMVRMSYITNVLDEESTR